MTSSQILAVAPLRLIVREFRGALLAIALISLLTNLLMLTPTLYMLQVYDRIMISQSGLTLIVLSVMALLLYAVMAFSDWARSRILVRAGVRFDERLNSEVFKANFQAALNQGQHKPVEALNDLTHLRQFITGNGVLAFFDLPWIPVYIAVSWLLHPTLGLLSMACAGVFLLVGGLGHLMTRHNHAQAQATSQQVSNFVQSKLRNAETVHSMGMRDGLRRRWLGLYRRQLHATGRVQDHAQRWEALTKFLQHAQQAVILGAGALLVIQGELTPGAMIAANVLMARALQPVQTLVVLWKSFMAARLAAQRLTRLLATHPPRRGAPVPPSLRGELVLKDLYATAASKAQPILQGLNAEIQSGEVVAIMGPSGCGKSTLLRCMLGIWPETRGEVLLDGHPVQDWDRRQLGPCLGYVPQDVELLEGTVAENIARFGLPDSEQVIAAAQWAGVHQMILRLPQGYDTPLGPGGSLLSGGQRQRIALARALYGNPSLVVLDEPDANLDETGEAALLRAIEGLRQRGQTVVVVSHRRGLLKLADRVLILAQGRVQASLPRDQVLEKLTRPVAIAA
ncbi:MAG: type I secretion system permease/ATPase [Curvibacter sp.]